MASFGEDSKPAAACELNQVIVNQFPYKFDRFQEESCLSLEKGHHSLCLAHTSAGKSTIALYAIAKALDEGKRLIYTAPVKSLSNQKYAELRKKYGDDKVGLATGDNKINVEADILVMTTEILRNLLSKPTWNANAIHTDRPASVAQERGEGEEGQEGQGEGEVKVESEEDRLAYVVFDEAHYINDRSRGNVYEECIMKLPSRVQMIFLSATMANPDHFCNWVKEIKPDRPLGVSSTLTRPVPLCFQVFVPSPETFSEDMPWDEAVKEGHMAVMLNGEHGVFQSEVYLNMVKRYNNIINFKTIKVKQERERLDGPKEEEGKKAPPITQTTKVVKRTIPLNMLGMMNKFVNFLSINGQLPAIFFTLSRKKCNVLANQVESTLITHTERREIENIFDHHIRGLADSAQYRQVSELRHLLMKGVGVHHSGMLTLLKEIVEIIFTKGLIKLMFATETLAIGVNTPTRVTCFTDVLKFDGYDATKRVLSIEEFKQMAGRAGRRGLDTVGNVIYFPVDRPLLLAEMVTMLSGPLRVLASNFSITTQYVLRLLKSTEQPSEEGMLAATRKSLLSQEMEMNYKSKESECGVGLGELDIIRADMEAILRRTPAIGELASMQLSLARDRMGQGATKKLRLKIQTAQAGLSKREQADHVSYEDLSGKADKLEARLQRLQEDILGEADVEIKIQLKSTVQFLLSSAFIFKGEGGGAEGGGEVGQGGQGCDSLQLTQSGLFASCISQCNEIVLTRAVFMGLADEIRHSPAQLCAWLALFVGSEQDESKGSGGGGQSRGPQALPEYLPEALVGACCTAMEVGETLLGEMTHSYFVSSEGPGTPPASELFPILAGPMYVWATRGGHFEEICRDYGFFEGNFVRCLQKMVNLFNELLLAFEVTNMPEWTNCVQRCKEEFEYGILLVGSIYI